MSAQIATVTSDPVTRLGSMPRRSASPELTHSSTVTAITYPRP